MLASIADKLYHRLPVPLQHAAYSARGWSIERTRHDARFRELLASAEERAYWSPERITDYRDQRLRAFVQHAVETVPFYRHRFREAGLAPDDIATLDDLQRLPLLTKEEVRNHTRELVSRAVPGRAIVVRKTSGTTGTPLRIASTVSALREQEAVAWRFRRWHGIEFGTWCAWIGGARDHVARAQQRPPYWRINYPGHQIFFSSAHTRPEQLEAAIGALRRRRVPWLHGLPSNIVLLAAHLLDAGEELGYPVRAITTAGEDLFPQQAELIEQAFGVPPRQRYVLTEAAAHASACELGLLHIDEDLAAVELRPNPDGSSFRVVGTNLSNPAMPLIRYDTGDDVSLADDPCPCGRPGRALDAIDGRLDDYIVLPDGSRMESFTLSRFHGIRVAQLHQTNIGRLTVRLVPAPDFSREEQNALVEFTKERVGAGTEVVVQLVEDVVRTPTGKARFMISELPEGIVGEVAERADRASDMRSARA